MFFLHNTLRQVSARVCALALLLATAVPPLPAFAAEVTHIIDNGDAAFSAEGWMLTVDPASGYEGDVHYIKPQTTSTPASWEFTNLEPGTYRVSAHWVPRTWLNPQAQYTVAGASSQTVTVDQRSAPSEWNTLVDAVTVDDMGTLRIELTSSIGDKYLYADAVKVEQILADFVTRVRADAGPSIPTPEGESGDVPTIDILLLYTPEAAQEAGGTTDIQKRLRELIKCDRTPEVDCLVAPFAEGILELNTEDVFALSEVHAEVRLVGIEEFAWSPDAENPNQDFTRFVRSPSVLALRNDYNADLVFLIVPKNAYIGPAGITYSRRLDHPLDSIQPNSTSSGFSDFLIMREENFAGIITLSDSESFFVSTFLHELGHVFGANHPRYGIDSDEVSVPNEPWNYAYIFAPLARTQVASSISCNSCFGFPVYSNANVYLTHPFIESLPPLRMGSPRYIQDPADPTKTITNPDGAENYITMNKFAQFIQHFRGKDFLELSTPSSLPNGVVGKNYNTQFTANYGIGSLTWSATNLPAGLQIDSTGVVYGTPVAAGTKTATITVRDATGAQKSVQATFTVLEPLTLTAPSTVPTGTVGTPYAATTFSADGGDGNYTWSASNLPAGLQIDSTGAVYGTPTAAGTKTATITVRDGTGQTKSTTVSITVHSALSIVPERGAMPWGIVGEQYAVALRALSAQGNVTWAATALPTGVSFADGVFSGTLSREGTFTPLISAEDETGTKVFYRPTVQVFAQDFDFYNDDICLDVNDDGIVSPFDFLNVINALNAISHNAGSQGTGMRYHPDPASVGFVDTDGNGVLTPLDGLRILNYLNDDDPNKDPRSRCN